MMRSDRHIRHGMGATAFVLATMLGSGGACAQATGAGAATPTSDEIVVTAQKREENIQKVPESISVVSGKDLVQTGSSQLTDFAPYIPGFIVTNTGTPGQSQLSIRGISPLGTGATVGTYLDDAPIGSSIPVNRGGQFTLDLLPYDVQRVEVLRGPQGTLYGASSIGGLLKYVTVAPSLTTMSAHFGGESFGIDHGGHAGYAAQAMVNTPLVKDMLGITASIAYRKTPGWIDNATTGATDQNDYDQLGARVSLLFKPIDPLSIRLSALYQSVEADNRTIIAEDATGQKVGNGRSNTNAVAEPFQNHFQFYDATIGYDFGFAALSSTTTYSRSKTNDLVDLTYAFGPAIPVFTGGAVASGFAPFDSKLGLKKLTEEVRLTSASGGMFEWLVGGFYTHERATHDQLVSLTTPDGALIPGLNPFEAVGLPSLYKEYAVFANGTVHFGERFDISGGIRYAKNRQNNGQTLSGVAVGGIDPALVRSKSNDDAVTYSVSPQFHLNKDVMLYGRVASGYRPGGPNVLIPGVAPAPAFKPDTLTNYEIGVKSDLLDRKLTLDVAAFRMDWNKIQVRQIFGAFAGIGNGGKARSQGVEGSLEIRPFKGLTLGANGAYTDAKLTQDAPTINGLDGARLPYIPKWSGALTGNYEFVAAANATASVGAGLRYQGSDYSLVSSDPDALHVASSTALDLNASITISERFTLRAYARNVLNSGSPIRRDYNATFTAIELVPLQPRTVGLAFDVAY
jgi:outer membrane receptor protein involved in Fe transport